MLWIVNCLIYCFLLFVVWILLRDMCCICFLFPLELCISFSKNTQLRAVPKFRSSSWIKESSSYGLTVISVTYEGNGRDLIKGIMPWRIEEYIYWGSVGWIFWRCSIRESSEEQEPGGSRRGVGEWGQKGHGEEEKENIYVYKRRLEHSSAQVVYVRKYQKFILALFQIV